VIVATTKTSAALADVTDQHPDRVATTSVLATSLAVSRGAQAVAAAPPDATAADAENSG
jgi:hypothetical protein